MAAGREDGHRAAEHPAPAEGGAAETAGEGERPLGTLEIPAWLLYRLADDSPLGGLLSVDQKLATILTPWKPDYTRTVMTDWPEGFDPDEFDTLMPELKTNGPRTEHAPDQDRPADS